MVPIPIIYYYLDKNDITYNIPPEYLEQGNKRMKRILDIFGVGELKSEQMIHLVASYAIVKTLMPLRIAISLYLTPYGAR